MDHSREDILEWAAAERISAANLRRALEIGGVLPDRERWRRFLDQLLLWLGVVMVAASVIFFLAYNWHELGRYAKFALAEGMIVAALAVLWWQGLERIGGKAALLAAALFTGALLALIGQTYQTGADTFELFAVWAVAILPWALLARLPALWVLWLALANLAVVLYFQAFRGFFGLIFTTERQLWLLFGLNTIALALWEGLALAGIAWLRERWALRLLATASGACVTALAVFAVFDKTAFGWALPVWLAWLGAAYALYRRRIRDLFVLAGGVLSSIVVVASGLSRLLLEARADAGGLFFIGLVIIAMSAAGGYWLKNVANEEGA
ncbi:MAG: DUF2157 domain-containing protein [Betaproteobacteria bacterium]|nr:DUF2157 domain-containing protein [Betaproteobacteria bacterium]MDH5577315.1 DUF2157 domain-containing protein [Betaproteobacteria bacterium]